MPRSGPLTFNLNRPMITRLHIENFKSLVDFRMPAAEAESLAPFTVLVGLNGSGTDLTVLSANLAGNEGREA